LCACFQSPLFIIGISPTEVLKQAELFSLSVRSSPAAPVNADPFGGPRTIEGTIDIPIRMPTCTLRIPKVYFGVTLFGL
tara:strand:- start:170 stop:406 length:237 start_codon:yes stop_codon:yes gene_type:complete